MRNLLVYNNYILTDIDEKEIPDEDFNDFDLKYIKEMNAGMKRIYDVIIKYEKKQWV